MYPFILLSTFLYAEENFHNEDFFHLKKKIYFHHIPKTAGISAISCVSQSTDLNCDFIDLNKGGRFFHYPLSSNDQKMVDVLDQKFSSNNHNKLFWSHIPFYYLDKYAQDISIFTILREPVKRQISYKLYYKHQLNTKYRDEVLFADHYLLTSAATTNLQTLYLTSLDPYDKNISMNDHLESAKYNLQNKIAFSIS